METHKAKLPALLIAMTLVVSTPCLAAEPRIELVGVKRIWDAAPHNAFTSLVRFQSKWVCAFREASAHVGPGVKGTIRAISSDDASTWTSVAQLSDPRGDLRDAKLAIMPDGRLMLLTAVRIANGGSLHHQSVAWFTSDLKKWDGPVDVGEPNVWLWGIRWHKGVGYSIGYSTTSDHFDRLYQTRDGVKFETIVPKLDIAAPFPNENAIAFDDADVAHCLMRCDPDHAFVGTAKAPYAEWTWKQSDARVGGPALMELPHGRLLGAGRLHDGKVRTGLFWVDPETASIHECLTLPSGGDTSYPGLVLHDGLLYVSYYSSHEEKTAIYLARCRITEGKAP